MPGRPYKWRPHDLELALLICTSTTELCHFLGVGQNGPMVASIRRHAERMGLGWLPANPRHGDGREKEPMRLKLGLLRYLCRE